MRLEREKYKSAKESKNLQQIEKFSVKKPFQSVFYR